MGDAALEPGALLLPFLAVGLPWMALTAAFDVVSETVPWLRGAMGSVVHLFLWLGSITLMYLPANVPPSFQDPTGYRIFDASLTAAARAGRPGRVGGRVVFVPTLALALGVVSSGGRDFEVVYPHKPRRPA